MNTSGEAADQVVRMTLNGVEVAAKLSGAAAKQVAVMLYAILKDQKRTKGKMRLSSMLRSGKELRVFAVQDKDLQKFCEAAKQYGILYCVLKDKNPLDGMTEIMAKAEDAAKINHIFERFKLATVDMASVKTEITKTKTKGAEDIPEPERTAPDRSEDFVDELMKKPSPTAEQAQTQNPTEARNAKSPQCPKTRPQGVLTLRRSVPPSVRSYAASGRSRSRRRLRRGMSAAVRAKPHSRKPRSTNSPGARKPKRQRRDKA